MHILSIQSSVAYGHVGNSSATFPLQRLGIEVSPVLTVHFSNHTGYGSWRGPVLAARDVADVLTGIGERGVFGTVDAVLSGYMGDAGIAEVILDAVTKVKAANPRAVYCLDPVMGDTRTGVYVQERIPPLIADLAVPVADLTTPNQFELEYLTGHRVSTVPEAVAAAAELRTRGPEVMLVTSLATADLPGDEIALLATSSEEAYLVSTPRLPLDLDGSGDMAAALFLAHWLRTGSLSTAVTRTANSVYAVLEETWRRGASEIQQVAAQDAIAVPPTRFKPVRVPAS
ncbi:MAG: pyridoxal kinase PdxY [Streptosporangiales bacterium]